MTEYFTSEEKYVEQFRADKGENEIEEYEENYDDVDDAETVEKTVKIETDEFSKRETLKRVVKNNVSDINVSESGKLLKKYIDEVGLFIHHIRGYDAWIGSMLSSDITGKKLTLPNGNSVYFSNVRLIPPRYVHNGKVLPLYPQKCRKDEMSYSADIHVDIVEKSGGVNGDEISSIKNICIGSLPVLIGSRLCRLSGKTDRELMLLGEDPKDIKGYFVVKGVEKIAIPSELLVSGRILLMKPKPKDDPSVRMTVLTNKGSSLMEIIIDKKTKVIKLVLPSLRETKQAKKEEKSKKVTDKEQKLYKSVNILRVFRLYEMMGIDVAADVNELIKLFVKPEHYENVVLQLTRNILDSMVDDDDVEKIITKMQEPGETHDENMEKIRQLFDSDIFPHINNMVGPSSETDEERYMRIGKTKVYMLTMMMCKLLENLAGYTPLSSKDVWSSKRIEGASRNLQQLTRSAWNKTLQLIQASIDKHGKDNKTNNKYIREIADKLKNSILTSTYEDSFISGKWGVKGSKMKDNVVQILERLTVMATYEHARISDVRMSRNDKQLSLRMIQATQFGYIDTSSTEGDNAGILKKLSLTTDVSLERDDKEIIRFLYGDSTTNLKSYVFLDEILDTKVVINGKFLGWCKKDETYKFLLDNRRSGLFPFDMSIVNIEGYIYIDATPSRVLRPLLIVDEDQTLVIDKKKLRNESISTIIAEGAMEYISAWEQEYIKLACTIDDIVDRKNLILEGQRSYELAELNLQRVKDNEKVYIKDLGGKEILLTLDKAEILLRIQKDNIEKLKNNAPFTHCEIDPKAQMGVSTSAIVLPNHNQAPRNTYQSSMSKQALGTYHSNHCNRMGDGKIKIMAYPQPPLVTTETYGYIDLDRKSCGQTLNTAFMAFPNTEEDAFVCKASYLQAGGFRIVKYITIKVLVKHFTGDYTEVLEKPPTKLLKVSEPQDRYKYIQTYEKNHPSNGLPMVGAYLRQGDCVVGVLRYDNVTKETRNVSSILKIGDGGIVDKVSVSSDGKTSTVIVKLRSVRTPQEGDKFSARNAQKGTISLVSDDTNLPYGENGEIPDLYTNPSCIPSRMTMAYFIEALWTKYSCIIGERINGSPFEKLDTTKIMKTISDFGLDGKGYHKFTSGTTGKEIPNSIFCNPVYIQALRHHVVDKIQARSTGPVRSETHQPDKGRSRGGGLRFGEMERDAAISSGTSAFLLERLMKTSDSYVAVICRTCGSFAVNDPITGGYRKCKLCDSNDSMFGKCTIPYVYKLLSHHLGCMGFFLRPIVKTSEEMASELFSTEPENTEAPLTLDEETQDYIDPDEDDQEQDDDGDYDYDEFI